MARPRVVASGVWQTSQAQDTTLASGRSYDLTADPYFTGKLQGFAGMRYTTNFRIAINATPFQQGILRFCYYPNYREAPSKAEMHLGPLRGYSQLPGSDFATSDGGLEVSVPFTSYAEYYNLETSRGDPLNYFLKVQSPLATGAAGPTTVKYTIWIWYTDVELFGTTTVQPQSAGSTRKKVKTRAAPLQEERPLSTWLSATSSLASSMGGIPIISGITGPTAYWLKRASALANSFGYSRPVNGEPVRPMAPHYHSSLANSDGINVSTVLAFNHDASSRIIDDFSPSGMDEMSTNFIKKQWAFLSEFTISTSTAAGTMVWKQDLGLNAPVVTDAYSRTYLTPLSFLGHLCRYYRGGVELDFRMVKTGFHAGTISLSYLTSETPPASVTENQTDLLHRTIVDIQEGSNVCLSFPFICRRAWLETYQNYGAVYAHVVNPLIAPETVSPSVTIQVFVRGMDDLEWSGMSNQSSIYPLAAMPLIAPQGGDPTQFTEVVCAPVGGTLNEPDLDGLAMMDCTSESITSLLVILKAGCRLLFPLGGPSDVECNFAFNPSTFACAGLELPSTATPQPFVCANFNAIRACYAFQRGGYELNLLGTSNVGPRTGVISLDNFYGAVGVFTSPAGGITGMQSTGVLASDNKVTQVYSNNNVHHGLSATLPYKSLFRANAIVPAVRDSSYDRSQFRSRFRVSARTYDTLLLRAAEDFQLMYWVGVPGMVMS